MQKCTMILLTMTNVTNLFCMKFTKLSILYKKKIQFWTKFTNLQEILDEIGDFRWKRK